MRFLFLLLLIIPAAAFAQINRSAKELAGENIKEYLATTIFRDREYKAISYGELEEYGDKRKVICWSLVHKFFITEKKMVDGKEVFIQKPYRFTFFLDRKMKVKRAETAYTE